MPLHKDSIILDNQAADPSTEDGEVFYNTNDGQFRGQRAGTVRDFLMDGDALSEIPWDAVISVSKTNPAADYTTIQAAINAAVTDQATLILVDRGEYVEKLTINKNNIYIKGFKDSSSQTNIQYNHVASGDSTITIESNTTNVWLENLNIYANTSGYDGLSYSCLENNINSSVNVVNCIFSCGTQLNHDQVLLSCITNIAGILNLYGNNAYVINQINGTAATVTTSIAIDSTGPVYFQQGYSTTNIFVGTTKRGYKNTSTTYLREGSLECNNGTDVSGNVYQQGAGTLLVQSESYHYGAYKNRSDDGLTQIYTLNAPNAVLTSGVNDIFKANLRQLTSDPSDASDGDVWYRYDEEKYKGSRNSVVGSFLFDLDLQNQRNLYVDYALGDDTYDGSLISPFKTIQAAVDAAATHQASYPTDYVYINVAPSASSYGAVSLENADLTKLAIIGPDSTNVLDDGSIPKQSAFVTSITAATNVLNIEWLLIKNLRLTGTLDIRADAAQTPNNFGSTGIAFDNLKVVTSVFVYGARAVAARNISCATLSLTNVPNSYIDEGAFSLLNRHYESIAYPNGYDLNDTMSMYVRNTKIDTATLANNFSSATTADPSVEIHFGDGAIVDVCGFTQDFTPNPPMHAYAEAGCYIGQVTAPDWPNAIVYIADGANVNPGGIEDDPTKLTVVNNKNNSDPSVVYVDAYSGKSVFNGSKEYPLKTIQAAVDYVAANGFPDDHGIIKVGPGWAADVADIDLSGIGLVDLTIEGAGAPTANTGFSDTGEYLWSTILNANLVCNTVGGSFWGLTLRNLTFSGAYIQITDPDNSAWADGVSVANCDFYPQGSTQATFSGMNVLSLQNCSILGTVDMYIDDVALCKVDGCLFDPESDSSPTSALVQRHPLGSTNTNNQEMWVYRTRTQQFRIEKLDHLGVASPTLKMYLREGAYSADVVQLKGDHCEVYFEEGSYVFGFDDQATSDATTKFVLRGGRIENNTYTDLSSGAIAVVEEYNSEPYTFYVDPTADNDYFDGSRKYPFATCTAAVQAVLAAAATNPTAQYVIKLAAGDYTSEGSYTIDTYQNADIQYLTVEGQPSASLTQFDGDDSYKSVKINNIDISECENLKRFIVKDIGFNKLDSDNSHVDALNLTEGLHIVNCNSQGSQIYVLRAEYIYFESSTFYGIPNVYDIRRMYINNCEIGNFLWFEQSTSKTLITDFQTSDLECYVTNTSFNGDIDAWKDADIGAEPYVKIYMLEGAHTRRNAASYLTANNPYAEIYMEPGSFAEGLDVGLSSGTVYMNGGELGASASSDVTNMTLVWNNYNPESRTFYVDPASGNDAYSGAYSYPLKTFTAAKDAVLAAAATNPTAHYVIKLAAGDYSGEGTIDFDDPNIQKVSIIGDIDTPAPYSGMEAFWAGWGQSSVLVGKIHANGAGCPSLLYFEVKNLEFYPMSGDSVYFDGGTAGGTELNLDNGFHVVSCQMQGVSVYKAWSVHISGSYVDGHFDVEDVPYLTIDNCYSQGFIYFKQDTAKATLPEIDFYGKMECHVRNSILKNFNGFELNKGADDGATPTINGYLHEGTVVDAIVSGSATTVGDVNFYMLPGSFTEDVNGTNGYLYMEGGELGKTAQTHDMSTWTTDWTVPYNPAPRTLHVSKAGNDKYDGSADYPFLTIQAAIDAASGTTPTTIIEIEPGTYNEKITLKSNVHLKGMVDSYFYDEAGSPATISYTHSSSGNTITIPSGLSNVGIHNLFIYTDCITSSSMTVKGIYAESTFSFFNSSVKVDNTSGNLQSALYGIHHTSSLYTDGIGNIVVFGSSNATNVFGIYIQGQWIVKGGYIYVSGSGGTNRYDIYNSSGGIQFDAGYVYSSGPSFITLSATMILRDGSFNHGTITGGWTDDSIGWGFATANASSFYNRSGKSVMFKLNLEELAADPTDAADGDMWYNTTTDKFRAWENGAAVDVIGAAYPPGVTQYYYVDINNGNDANIGSIYQPVETIQQAVTLAAAYQTINPTHYVLIHLKAGNYRSQGTISIPSGLTRIGLIGEVAEKMTDGLGDSGHYVEGRYATTIQSLIATPDDDVRTIEWLLLKNIDIYGVVNVGPITGGTGNDLGKFSVSIMDCDIDSCTITGSYQTRFSNVFMYSGGLFINNVWTVISNCTSDGDIEFYNMAAEPYPEGFDASSTMYGYITNTHLNGTRSVALYTYGAVTANPSIWLELNNGFVGDIEVNDAYNYIINANQGSYTRSLSDTGGSTTSFNVFDGAHVDPWNVEDFAGLSITNYTYNPKPNTLYVSKKGKDCWNGQEGFPFLTIQAAIDACDGVTWTKILVDTGVYTEKVNVNKNNVHIIGTNQSWMNDVENSGALITYEHTINGATVTINGNVKFENISVLGSNASGSTNLSYSAVSVSAGKYLFLMNSCWFTGKSKYSNNQTYVAGIENNGSLIIAAPLGCGFESYATGAEIITTAVAIDSNAFVSHFSGDSWAWAYGNGANNYDARFNGASTLVLCGGSLDVNGGETTEINCNVQFKGGTLRHSTLTGTWSDQSDNAKNIVRFNAGYVSTSGKNDLFKLNLRELAADPTDAADGDMWYNTTTDKFRAWENGAAVDVISPGSGWPFITNIITVDPAGTADYTTIQAAVSAASPGDIIYIAPATYNEKVVLTDGITLYGMMDVDYSDPDPTGSKPLLTFTHSTTGATLDISGLNAHCRVHNLAIEAVTTTAGVDVYGVRNIDTGSYVDLYNCVVKASTTSTGTAYGTYLAGTGIVEYYNTSSTSSGTLSYGAYNNASGSKLEIIGGTCLVDDMLDNAGGEIELNGGQLKITGTFTPHANTTVTYNGGEIYWTEAKRVLYVSSVRGNDLFNGSEKQPFATIQAAIDYATTNTDTVIWIEPGYYEEKIVHNKNKVHLKGVVAPAQGAFYPQGYANTDRPQIWYTHTSNGYTLDMTNSNDCIVENLNIFAEGSGTSLTFGCANLGYTEIEFRHCQFETGNVGTTPVGVYGMYQLAATTQIENCVFDAYSATATESWDFNTGGNFIANGGVNTAVYAFVEQGAVFELMSGTTFIDTVEIEAGASVDIYYAGGNLIYDSVVGDNIGHSDSGRIGTYPTYDYIADIFSTGIRSYFKLWLESLTADPTDAADGQIWYRSDTDEYFGRRNGSSDKFLQSGDAIEVQDFGSHLVPTGTTQTIDFATTGRLVTVDLGTATGNVTLTLNNPVPGTAYVIRFIQGATRRQVVWPSNVEWPGGNAPSLSNADDDIDIIQLLYGSDPVSGFVYYGNFSLKFS